MSEFSVRVWRIHTDVINHPNADRLNLVRIGGFDCISNKLEDGSARYSKGDYVIYIPEASILPEWLLRRLDMWNEEEGKGFLAGSKGDRVKMIKLRGLPSLGVLMPVYGSYGEYWIETENDSHYVISNDDPEGIDVAELLGIVKWEPPIPTHMAGEVANVFGHTMMYDFENLETVPDLFDQNDVVVASEKLHGSYVQIAYVPNLAHPEMFGDGDILVCSKGLGSRGLVFKNNEANDFNIYVVALRKLLANGLHTKLKNLSEANDDKPINIFAEVFDIAIGKEFVDFRNFQSIATSLGLPVVPLLYHGPFDEEVLKSHRDGKTTFGGVHIREGIVIKSVNEDRHPLHGRKIGKMVSPDYRLRKSNSATEYQ